MSKFWKRGGDRELEAQLRARRPEPRPEVTRAIADRVRPSRSGREGLSRVPLGLAGGLTAIVLAVVIALGGGSYPLDVAREALNVENASKSNRPPPPEEDQYGRRVVVCMADGRTQRVVTEQEAEELVRTGQATRGPCRRPPRSR